jgi:uncharacterized protein
VLRRPLQRGDTLSAVTRYPLRQLRLRSGSEEREYLAVELEPFALGGARYLPVPAEAPAELTISRATSGDVFRLRFSTRLHGPCMRCLADAVVELHLDGREYHASEPGAEPGLRCDYVLEAELALSDWARDLISEALPEQILCRSDCAGLCPECGKDLNLEPHAHEREEADPRWRALEALREREPAP